MKSCHHFIIWIACVALSAAPEALFAQQANSTNDENLWDDGGNTAPASTAEDLWDDGSVPSSQGEAAGGTPSNEDLWNDTPELNSSEPGDLQVSSDGIASGVGLKVSGNISAEYRYFWDPALNSEQENSDLSVAAKPRFFWELGNGNQSFTLEPFLRLDSVDTERTHADLREALYQTSSGQRTIRIGVGQVFWGVTETRHVVDIINQTDLVENPEQEDKLGEPLINATFYNDELGNLDLFYMPWFRERTFPGRKGRLRTTPRVINDNAIYTDEAENNHFNIAARWSHSINAWDIALSQFHGTSREPLFVPAQDGDETVLLQRYDIIDQTGLELQFATDSALLKFEGYSRWGQGDQFFALDTGIEYTLGDVAGSGADIGLLAEYLYESRDLGRWDDALVFNSFSNAVMLGMRFALNDVAGSDGLASILFDRKSNAKLFKLEASRRLNEQLRINLQLFGFIDIPENDPAYTLRQDSFAKLELSYYF